MKALDTSVLVRVFVDDAEDAESQRQRPAALAALRQRVLVTVTVLLEFEWVLRGFHDFTPRAIGAAMRTLLGFDNVTVEDRDAVLSALDVAAGGLDFPDALHLARSQRAAAFVTFDRKLHRRATAAASAPPVELLR